MAIKKSELYSSLWKSCDELRGGMDSSQYKDYVLVLLFIKYISDKYAGKKHALITIPEGGGFQDMVALVGTKDIGEQINLIIAKLAEENELRGVIDVADFNDEDKLGRGKEMVDRLSNLIEIFQNPALDFSKNRAEGDDLMGDAYEYLMRFFATESGKSKGQFLTPSEVSRVLAKLVGISYAQGKTETLYDPTCGSGSLLLKAADESPAGISIYGQEMDNATAALAKMNMILHDNATAEIWQDNTLASPHFKAKDGSLKTFDYVVANPPFSAKAWSNGFDPANDLYGRFGDGIPPAKNGDYAFLLHIIRSLNSTGRAAVILPHGVLFRGNAEATIRKNLIRKGYIKGIVGLPANLFYGTGIPACIIVLDKNNAVSRSGIFMIDASKGFRKDGNKNRLRAQDIHKIVDTFNRQVEVPKYARMVPLAEIEANEFNLNIPRYIDSSEPEDLQDIEAHLKGGIPNRDLDALANYWTVLPSVRNELFESAGREGYSKLKVSADAVKTTIFEHAEFKAFKTTVDTQFAAWRAEVTPKLNAISADTHPKALIKEISEALLVAFEKVPLLDAYDVYQRLMDYWDDTMQDDAYMLVADGWKAVLDDKPNTDLISGSLIVARYFAAEQAAIEKLEADRDVLAQKLEAMEEEHGGEEGPLADAFDEKGKISQKSFKAAKAMLLEAAANSVELRKWKLVQIENKGVKTKEAKKAASEAKKAIAALLAAAEQTLLKTEDYLTFIAYEELMGETAEADKAVKDAIKQLNQKVFSKYSELSVEEIRVLVVEDKWLARLDAETHEEMSRVSLLLANRIAQLAGRYEFSCPVLEHQVSDLSKKVSAHLQKMGFVWN